MGLTEKFALNHVLRSDTVPCVSDLYAHNDPLERRWLRVCVVVLREMRRGQPVRKWRVRRAGGDIQAILDLELASTECTIPVAPVIALRG